MRLMGIPLQDWSSLYSDPQWIYVDLVGIYSINEVNPELGIGICQGIRDSSIKRCYELD